MHSVPHPPALPADVREEFWSKSTHTMVVRHHGWPSSDHSTHQLSKGDLLALENGKARTRKIYLDPGPFPQLWLLSVEGLQSRVPPLGRALVVGFSVLQFSLSYLSWTFSFPCYAAVWDPQGPPVDSHHSWLVQFVIELQIFTTIDLISLFPFVFYMFSWIGIPVISL